LFYSVYQQHFPLVFLKDFIMLRYETLMLAVPEITADESNLIEQQFNALIKKNQGIVNSYERWGKYRLAYQVWKNDYGVYFLTRFDANPAIDVGTFLKDIHELLSVKYGSVIMRHLTTKLLPKQSTAYLKPESLEDMPSQDVDTFLRDNKGRGFRRNDSSAQDRLGSVLDEDVDTDDESEIEE
jgi:ribosomal protein S6